MGLLRLHHILEATNLVNPTLWPVCRALRYSKVDRQLAKLIKPDPGLSEVVYLIGKQLTYKVYKAYKG